MNTIEWLKKEYVELAPQIAKSKKVESHPCKYTILNVKTISSDEAEKIEN